VGENSAIGWTDDTMNFWQGCTKISPGCKFCYMYRDKARYGQDPRTVVRSSDATFYAALARDKTGAWKRTAGRRQFTNSWSDFFIPEADNWRDDAYGVIDARPDLIWQVLTKRIDLVPGRLPATWGTGWPQVHLGVSVENAAYTWRIDMLRETPAALRFLSLEPLLGPLPNLDLRGIGWVITGGESGADGERRDCEVEWFDDIASQCDAAGVPLFVKQDSGRQPGQRGRIPARLWRHEFPKAA